MITVVVDAATRSTLKDLHEDMQFTDETGRLLGHFRSAVSNSPGEPQVSDAEIEQRLRQGGGRALAAIMADLDKKP